MPAMVPAQRPAASSSTRQATEDALLDALEAVLLRDGLRNLSVNAVVEAAGVGKPLLYRYFGDLPGLVRAWGERRGLWADLAAQGEPPSRQATDDRSFRSQVTDELVGVAEYLRGHPVSTEFLAEELSAHSDLSDAFAAARADHRRPFLRAMLADPRYLRRDNQRLIVVLYAAITYLAMRSTRSPAFMGLRLDTESGWDDAMAMVREIAALAMPDDAPTPAPNT
jgi:AcrR family transcriptional regulator